MVNFLPQPLLINGLKYIPPPSSTDFEAEFSGILPKGKSIPSSWGVTHYYDYNPTAAATAQRVLVIHGAGTPAIGMAPLALKLAEGGSHVVGYDLWGHGNSASPLAPHTPALFHAQVFELLSHLGWLNAHFVGFSFGAVITATFTAIHPHVVQSATIVAGAGLLRAADLAWFDDAELEGGKSVLGFLEGNVPVREGWKERLSKGVVDTEPVKKWQIENHKGHVASLVSMFRCGGLFDSQESFGKFAGTGLPVFSILGEADDDIGVEYTKKELVRLGWKGEIVVVEGATHDVVRTHAGEVAKLVKGFWETLK